MVNSNSAKILTVYNTDTDVTIALCLRIIRENKTKSLICYVITYVIYSYICTYTYATTRWQMVRSPSLVRIVTIG